MKIVSATDNIFVLSDVIYDGAPMSKKELLRALMKIDPEHPYHGTPGGYTTGGCRCDRCVAAKNAYQQAYRQRMKERATEQGIPEEAHGTLTGYQTYGCRCPQCKSFIGNYYKDPANRWQLPSQREPEEGS